MIFVDADAFIALYNKDDFHHKKAERFLAQLKELKEELITSWDVVDETATKLSRFLTKKSALNFFQNILKGQIIIIYPDSAMAKTVLEIFKSQKSKKVSLTDCTNMAIARQKGIKIFFSFDRHYKDNGFKLL